MDKPDFESTTAMLARRAPGLAWIPSAVRKHLTPAALWSAITLLTGGIWYVFNAQADLRHHQESIIELQSSRQQDREILERIDKQLAVVSSQMTDMIKEVDRQREWRDRIETVAEEPSHVRRRPR